MQSKSSLYTFVGYFIPGAIVTTMLYWLCVGFFAIPLNIGIQSVGESIVFLAVSYAIGHIIQAYSGMIERRAAQRWGGDFSEQFLRDDNNYYTKEFKDGIKEGIYQTFFLSTDLNSDSIDIKKKRAQEVFSLCYILINQENIAAHTEVFLGLYSLYRGMLIAATSGAIVGGIIAVKHLVLWLFPDLASDADPFLRYDSLQLELGVVALVLSLVAIPLLRYRHKDSSQHFANSVYRGFYAWYRRKQPRLSNGRNKFRIEIRDER